MNNLSAILTLLLILAFAFGAISCGGGEGATPTPTLEPSPTVSATPMPTATPKGIDWTSLAERINRLAGDSGFNIHEVLQLFDDIVEIGGKGECESFALAVGSEPDLELVGVPQVSPDGICTIWFRVLPTD